MTGLETTAPTTRDQDPGRSRSLLAIFEHLFLPERDPLYIFLLLGIITLTGLLIRTIDLNQSIAYDEAYTFIHFASRPFKHILADYSAPNNHIFHTILMGISYRMFGGEAWALRLPAFLAGVLTIPAMYITARRFFSAPQALGAAALTTIVPVFINYSVNGRGYTLLILLSILLVNFAGILVIRRSKPALIAFILTAALGFYTIPIFLYPMAGISLWMVGTYLSEKESWQTKVGKLGVFVGACFLAGLLTLFLYSPVIFFGSGLSSILSNEIVQSLNWSTFLENLDPRLIKTWNKWMIGFPRPIENMFLGGFLVSVFFHPKVSSQKLPLQVFLALGVVIPLLLQRVTPLPRIWLYLEAFYLMFSAAGLVWLAGVILRTVTSSSLAARILSFGIVLIFAWSVTNSLISRQQNPVYQDLDLLPEAYVADYIAAHLKPQDTIVATGPVDIQTAYYLSLHEISFDRFYKRDHPVEIQNALVLLRENSKYKTPESVVEFFKLDDQLDLSRMKLVYEYASVQVFSIPAR